MCVNYRITRILSMLKRAYHIAEAASMSMCDSRSCCTFSEPDGVPPCTCNSVPEDNFPSSPTFPSEQIPTQCDTPSDLSYKPGREYLEVFAPQTPPKPQPSDGRTCSSLSLSSPQSTRLALSEKRKAFRRSPRLISISECYPATERSHAVINGTIKFTCTSTLYKYIFVRLHLQLYTCSVHVHVYLHKAHEL